MSSNYNMPVAATVLEDTIDLNDQSQEPDTPVWLSMYQNSSLINFKKPEITDPKQLDPSNHYEYNRENNEQRGNNSLFKQLPYVQRFQPQHPQQYPQYKQHPTPPQQYQQAVNQNYSNQYYLNQQQLQATPPAPLPYYGHLPTFKPPYGTPYPTTGYSAYDSATASATHVPMATANPGLPIGTPPALEDARYAPAERISVDREKELEFKFREGYNKAKSEVSVPTCGQSIHHALSCSVCKKALMSSEKMMMFGIIFLAILCLILIIIILRKPHSIQALQSQLKFPKK